MILKASQRGGGQDLAIHLMRLDDNEHVDLHELRGFAADDLKGAFKEAEAISLGTRCDQYLFSLSLSPPEDERVAVEHFEEAIGRIEERLGLQDQPRAIVFHEKEGRRHAHCVWSRIDADTMTARQLSFFKRKLMQVSRDLYLEHGWKMPAGIEREGARNPTNFSLAEWQQAKRNGTDPRWLKETVQRCWTSSDSPRAFENALGDHAMLLAKGDRRGLVLVDHDGEVHALSRLLDLKGKDITARLGTGPARTVAQAKSALAGKMTPALRAHVAEAKGQFARRSAKLGEYRSEMTKLHRAERIKLAARQSLEWEHETKTRAARLPRGLRGLWHRITGQYQLVRSQNEAEAHLTQRRHSSETHALVVRQLDQRALVQSKFRELRKGQAGLLLALRRDLARVLALTREPAAERSREQGIGLRLER